MASKSQRINWHNVFSRVLKHRWTPLGLTVLSEYEVVKHPLKIDVVVIRKEKEPLSPEKLAQLPDGIRENLKEHNLIDFKSIRESYSRQALKKTEAYATHYEEEERINVEQLSIFSVAAMTPKKLLTEMRDWVEMQSNGVYRFRLPFRDVILLVPNEMDKSEANDVLELFASQRDRYLSAIRHMASNSIWFSLKGIFNIFSQRLGKELTMSGLTLDQLAEEFEKEMMEDITPEKFGKLFAVAKNKKQLLAQALEQIDDEELDLILKDRQVKKKT